MFQSIIPTLRVSDSRQTQDLLSKLGFQAIWEHQEAPEAPRFVELANDKVSLFLSEHPGDGPEGISLYFVVEDARKLYDVARASGISIENPPSETEWNHLTFEFEDFDGNSLRFGSPL